MTLKATWLWNGSSANGRINFGFSESWYSDDSPAALFPKMLAAARSRANILATGTFLYGFRVADTAPNSRAYTQLPGVSITSTQRSAPPNVPQDAALCVVNGSVAGTRKRFWFHDLPDGVVSDSAFVDAEHIPDACRTIINQLGTLGFKFRYVVQTAPTAKVLSIGATGIVTTAEALTGVAVRSQVQLLKVRGVDGRGKRGKFYVEEVTDEFSFKLRGWPGDVVGVSGKIRLLQYAYTSLEAIPANGIGSDPTVRPGVRKCGRPFGQLRGRAVARR